MLQRFFVGISLALSISLSAQTSTMVDTFLVIHRDTVYFDFGSDILQPGSDTTLRAVAARLESRAVREVLIRAHTDAVGADLSNQALSERRAQHTRLALLELGLPEGKVQIEGFFGARQPVANNTDEAGRQRNRRAELEVRQRFKMDLLEGVVRDAETGDSIPNAEVRIKSPITEELVRADSFGVFRGLVPILMDVEVTVQNEGFFPETQTTRLDGRTRSRLELEVVPARPGAVQPIKNLYFVGNQAILLKKSEPELPKLLRFMQINPVLRIEIAGHINLPNSPRCQIGDSHYDLSLRRAKAVYDYLLSEGVPENRMQFRGYGNWEMVYPNARSEQEQALNRRVEIRIQ
jgi:outer membrane protein OmpA-like peptidoglycan-associated protein